MTVGQLCEDSIDVLVDCFEDDDSDADAAFDGCLELALIYGVIGCSEPYFDYIGCIGGNTSAGLLSREDVVLCDDGPGLELEVCIDEFCRANPSECS